MPRRDLPNVAIWAFEDLWDLFEALDGDLQPLAQRELSRQEVRFRAQRALTQLARARVVIAGVRPAVTRTRTQRRAERVAGDQVAEREDGRHER